MSERSKEASTIRITFSGFIMLVFSLVVHVPVQELSDYYSMTLKGSINMFYDDIDDSEIFAEEENDDFIDPYIQTDRLCSEPEWFDPDYYDKYVLSDNYNIKVLKKEVALIVERYREHGVYADVVVIDTSRDDSEKHRRKTVEDIQTIKKYINQGLNNSEIARLTGITRKTIARPCLKNKSCTKGKKVIYLRV